MGDPLEFPKIRWPIDIRLERLDAQEVLLLNCPLGISPQPLLLVPAVGPILSCFEGNLSIAAITKRFDQYGLQEKTVRELAQLLDTNLFLASPSFFAAEKRIKEEFRLSNVRPPALVGGGYAASADALTKEIDGYLELDANVAPQAEQDLLGMVSPHIDYRRGSRCYGVTYRHLPADSHDLYIVIGTAHQYSRRLFHLTPKDFPTPLGLLPTDGEFVDTLAARHGVGRSFEDEFLHRREHSLELQLPFLHRISKKPKVAPILVGGFHHMLNSGKFPEAFEEYDSFASALKLGIAERLAEGKRICVIAGVDMAHVGQSFGDTDKLSPEFMEHVRLRDQIYLDAITRQDRHALFTHIAEDEDRRRMCGFPTMYTVLDVFHRLGLRYRARVFDYRQAVDYQRECAVTFAGVGLYLETGNAAQRESPPRVQ